MGGLHRIYVNTVPFYVGDPSMLVFQDSQVLLNRGLNIGVTLHGKYDLQMRRLKQMTCILHLRFMVH